ncbi:unnamed protein product [Staurois parvus]|uniref:Uncharacterized protein n=1 Tax=Staurois parvus TaxID=386267 RepID=A0ABN9FE07_9NEOB|nr:unnamed protein product [Staurois parvus]
MIRKPRAAPDSGTVAVEEMRTGSAHRKNVKRFVLQVSN